MVNAAVYEMRPNHFCFVRVTFSCHTEYINIGVHTINDIWACPENIDNDNGIAKMLAAVSVGVSRSRKVHNHAHGRYEALAIMFRLPMWVTNIDENWNAKAATSGGLMSLDL
tara:strand:+ start:1439 stop:1774 length:336 start_codon:yes stop_codon:yes gene_type:complete